MIYALYIEQKITIFALYTKHKYKNQINNLTMENELQVIGTKEVEERIIELRGQKYYYIKKSKSHTNNYRYNRFFRKTT